MKNPTYYNGVICPFENASIPLTDRSFFFSDAVYDVMIGRNKTPYQFTNHIKRLRDNCNKIGLSISKTDEEILDIANELISLTTVNNFMIYIQISGASLHRTHKRDNSYGNLFLMISEISVPSVPNYVRAILFPDLRYNYCHLKTTNLLPAVLSMEYAADHNADIAIFHRENEITEASYANIFLIKDGMLITPPLNNHLLPGITRENIIYQSNKLGIACSEKRISTNELLCSDGVFFSSTTKLLQICSKIDKNDISGSSTHTVTAIFNALYEDFLRYTE